MLALKLCLIPLLIGAITLAGRRWGPAIAGWLSGFPVVTGPILLFISIEQGPMFASAVSVSALSGVMANVCFGVGYAWAAVRYPWWISALAGFAAYAAAGLVLTVLEPTVYQGLVITLSGLWLASKAFPRHLEIKPGRRLSPVELPLRMLAGAALAACVAYYAENLGSRLSGIFSIFPVMASVLAIFTHTGTGPDAAVRFLRAMLTGMYACAMFCVALALALPALGTGLGFLIALVCALAVQAASLWIASSSMIASVKSVGNARPHG